jgi:hypothetical protein
VWPRESIAPVHLFPELAAISRRLWIRDLLGTTTVVVPGTVVVWLLLAGAGAPRPTAAAIATIIAACAAIAWLVSRRVHRSTHAAARAVERAHPESRNLVITAEELARHPERARPWILDRVLAEAANITRAIRPSDVVALRGSALMMLISTAVALSIPFAFDGTVTVVRDAVQQGGTESQQVREEISIEAIVDAPAYSGEPRRTLRNPERIEALQGSRIGVFVRGAGEWRVRVGAQPLEVRRSSEGARVDLTLGESGYLAIEPVDSGASAAKRLVPLTAISDRAPSIRLESPGKDLLLPDPKPVVGVTVSATDDFGLQSLELRYTTASGSGERFEFQEGTVPLEIATESDRAWRARARISAAALGLAPGDAIIYRVVGRDRRPGDAGIASSDTFFIEIVGPGQVAVEGFDLPPDTDRYALSQQMIVLKLERLRARERSLDRGTLESEASNIAAEQRAVRANFIFLMGGTVEDEEQEAEHSHEIQEGRLQNTARQEIVAAIQHMGRVERELALVSTSSALPPARAAVDALQRAFGRNRYFLRTLPSRSRVDFSRRLTGDLSRAEDSTREVRPHPQDRSISAARALVARLLDLAPSVRAGSAQPRALTALAEEALAADPAAQEWQAISKSLLMLRDALSRDEAERTMRLNAAVAATAAVAARDAVGMRSLDRGNGALRSAWAEERRR